MDDVVPRFVNRNSEGYRRARDRLERDRANYDTSGDNLGTYSEGGSSGSGGANPQTSMDVGHIGILANIAIEHIQYGHNTDYSNIVNTSIASISDALNIGPGLA